MADTVKELTKKTTRAKRSRLPIRKTYTGPRSLRHITTELLSRCSYKALMGVLGGWLWPGTGRYASEIYAEKRQREELLAQFDVTFDPTTLRVDFETRSANFDPSPSSRR